MRMTKVKPLIIAHRGFSYAAPENTLPSFIKAIESGADYMECDIQLTKDFVPVVIHDQRVDRTTTGPHTGSIVNLNLKEIKTLNAHYLFDEKYQFYEIPTLAEVFQLSFGTIKIFIELKGEKSPPEEIVHEVLKVVPANALKDTIFGSFNLEIIKLLQQRLPNQQLIGLVDNESQISAFLEIKVSHLGLDKEICHPVLLEQLGIQTEVWVYTVDDTEQALKLVHMGALGIITNNPELMINFFSNMDEMD